MVNGIPGQIWHLLRGSFSLPDTCLQGQAGTEAQQAGWESLIAAAAVRLAILY